MNGRILEIRSKNQTNFCVKLFPKKSGGGFYELRRQGSPEPSPYITDVPRAFRES
jgi:hypothetical protein